MKRTNENNGGMKNKERTRRNEKEKNKSINEKENRKRTGKNEVNEKQ